MKAFFTRIRNLAIGGFLFLMPAIVVLILDTKAWSTLSSVGPRIAGLFGMKSILGLTGTNVFTGLLMIAICLLCGLLVRISFFAAMSRKIESGLSRYMPGYETYRAMAIAKLEGKTATLSFTSAMVKQQGFWQPAYVIEEDSEGNCVVFFPQVPDTNNGHIVLASHSQVILLSSLTAVEFDDLLRRMGKGLLRNSGIQALAARSGD